MNPATPPRTAPRSHGPRPVASGPVPLDPETLDAALDLVAQVCDAMAAGDLERRIPPLPDDPRLGRIRLSINNLVDIIDAFVREAGASLCAAGEGRYHRAFLLGGMLGEFRDGAVTINTARAAMADAERELQQEQRERAELTDRAREISEQVAAASTQLGASAASLAGAVHTAVAATGAALDVVNDLRRSSTQISQTTNAIKKVASQTRLLALNATIEAARAGTYGLGFAVVAGEVKALADQVTRSSDDITSQTDAAGRASESVVQAIDGITTVIREMSDQVDGIAAAAGGADPVAPSLARLAEILRAEISELAGRPGGG